MDYLIERAKTPEYKRLQTFYMSPIPGEKQLSLSNSPLKLAEAGFVRTPTAKSDEVECASCGIKYKDWCGESPLSVHWTLSPNCPFLNTPSSSCLSGPTQTRASSNIHTIRRQLFSDTSFNAADFQIPFLTKGGDNLYIFESHRLMSFSNVHSTQASLYAKGGFILNKNNDTVMCVFCSVELDQNISSQQSHLQWEHERLSPNCPFVQGFDVGNVSRDDEAHIRKKVLSQKIVDKLGGKQSQCKYIIRHPEFELTECRYETFTTWPKLHTKLFPPQVMVDAGFYYSGFMDKVQCYACGVAMYNWAPPADPARQHAKASPSCHFLLNSRGQEFIQAAQVDELIVDAEHEEASEAAAASGPDSHFAESPLSPSSPAAASSTTSPSCTAHPGSATLDLEAVKAAMACQYPKYSIERIAHAIRKFFVDSCGRYPNTSLLLGTLKAADENYSQLVEKSQEVVETKSQLQAKDNVIQDKDNVIQAKDNVIQDKDSVIQATRSELQAKDSQLQAKDTELQRAAFELQWRNLEMRSELEQQFVGQIQQAREMLHEKDQALEQKDQALEQKDQVIEHKDVELEMKDKEVEDLQRHIRSLRAELDRRRLGLPLSDDEDSSSAASSDTERRSSSMSQSSSSPSDSDSEASSPDDFPVASCKVCLVKPSQIVFLPCKHLCCCERCAARLHGKNCPICRERNLGYEKVYVI